MAVRSRTVEDNPHVLLETAAGLLGLKPYEEVRSVMTFATGVRSEVQVLQVEETGERFVAKQYLGDDHSRRFIAETSVLRALSTFHRTLVPRLHALSVDDFVIVTNEVAGLPLENVLRDSDAPRARHELHQYAGAIGLLHAASDALVELRRARHDAGYRNEDFLPPFARDAGAAALRIASLTESPSKQLDSEIRDVVKETFTRESEALIQWDTWPGNAIATRVGVTLVDLENTFCASALLDVSSWHLAFPAAPLRHPFAAPLPGTVVTEMDRAYERAAGRAVNTQELAMATAGRMLFELTAPSAPRLLSDLAGTPVTSLYQLRLRQAVAIFGEASVLPALAAAMDSLAQRLVPGDSRELRSYAAFA